MSNQKTSGTPEKSVPSSAENQKDVENHKKAAQHFEEAAKHHHEAAKQHEDGNHEKAAASTIKAQGYSSLANEAQKEDVKRHAMKS